jgi:hypothetical protein
MTIALWSDAVRLAKIKHGKDPKGFMRIQGKLLTDAQAIYHVLQTSRQKKARKRSP